VDEVKDLPNFQTIALLWESSSGDRAENLYLLGFENTGQFNPMRPGTDQGLLYSVQLPAVVSGQPGELIVQKVGQRQEFDCEDDYCNMDASTGLYVATDGRLVVHSAFHFLKPVKKPFLLSLLSKREFVIKLSEFRSVAPTDGDPVTSIDDAWIELFDEPNLAGRRLSLFGPAEANIEDYGKIRVQGESFKKEATSLRCRIPAGFAYALFPEKKHKGTPLVVMGTGNAVRIDDLSAHNFNNRTQSSRYVDPLVAWNKPGRIWIGPDLPNVP
jgi:hypothetical protein